MDIRETLGQMVRGSIVNILDRHVEFNYDGEFVIWTYPRGNAPVHVTKSLKEVVEYFDMLPGVPPPLSKALKEMIIPEALTEIDPPPSLEVLSDNPTTQLYGRARRPVGLEEAAYNSAPLAYEIPTLGTLVEPCTPYGYINTDGLATMCETIHRYNVDAGWWTDINTGEKLERNVPEMLMLIVSEVSEAMEGYRKDLMDDKLPHRKMIEVELADALIRICDTAEGLGLDLAGAVQEKVLFNVNRADHKI